MGHHHLDKEQAAQIADAHIHQVGGFEAARLLACCSSLFLLCMFPAEYLISKSAQRFLQSRRGKRKMR